MSEVANDAGRFEAAIRAFEAGDRRLMPRAGGTVFVGSSSFTRWSSLEEEFREFDAINRGFGGSTFPDLLYYFDRVVTPYRPARIVVYEGTNDIATGRSAIQVYGDFVRFAERVKEALGRAEVFCLSVNAGPGRAAVAGEMQAANRLLREYISTEEHLHFVDLWGTLLDDRGAADPRYYADPVHPNEAGYARWVPVIKSALRGRKNAGEDV